MKRHVKRLVARVAVFAGALPTPAEPGAPAPPEITILRTSDGCGEVTLRADPGGGVSVRLASFTAKTGEGAPRVRRICVAQLGITTAEDFTVERGNFEVSGTATIAPGTTGSSVDVRYFADGDAGADYHRDLVPGPRSANITGVSQGKPRRGACGSAAQVTLLIDATARSIPEDAAKTSSIEITEIKLPALHYERCTPVCPPEDQGAGCLARRRGGPRDEPTRGGEST